MKVVVRRQRPLLFTLIVILILVILGAAGWTFIKEESERSHTRASEMATENQRLVVENQRLVAENQRLAGAYETLSREVVRIERASEIESRAYAEVDAHLGALQEELQAAKEEVSFYQGITAESGAPGVRIQRFSVEPGQGARHYRFRLVLTRGLKDDTVFEGSIEIAVDGELGQTVRRLSHHEAMAAGGDAISFKFRYFQRIEDELALPEYFAPKSVTVRIRAKGKESAELEQSFAWPS